MLATGLVAIRPPPISIKATKLYTRKSCGKFVIQSQRLDLRRGKSVRELIPKGMVSGSVRTRFSTDEESVNGFEQEALVEESQSTSFGAGGLEATLNNLSKWIIAAGFGLLVLWRHDAEALWAAMGGVLNTALSAKLKTIINQERPVSGLRSDPGMPSSHSQSIFYGVTFSILSMVEWFGWNEITATLSTSIFAVGSYFSWLRVSQKLHTIDQVLVGALLGTICSFLWFWLWQAFILEAFVSSSFVRIVVVLVTAAICLTFLIYVIRTWVMDEVLR